MPCREWDYLLLRRSHHTGLQVAKRPESDLLPGLYMRRGTHLQEHGGGAAGVGNRSAAIPLPAFQTRREWFAAQFGFIHVAVESSILLFANSVTVLL